MVAGQRAQIVDQRVEVVAGFQQNQAAPMPQGLGSRLDQAGEFEIAELLRLSEHRHTVAVATQVLDQRTRRWPWPAVAAVVASRDVTMPR